MKRSLLCAVIPAACLSTAAGAQTLPEVVTSLTALDARVTLQAGAITVIDGRVTQSSQAISLLEADRVVLSDRIAAIDAAAAAQAQAIATAQTSVQAQVQSVAALGAQVQASVAAGDALAVRLDAQADALATLDTSFAGQAGAVATLGARVDAHDATIQQQGARIEVVNQIAVDARDASVTLRADVDAGRAGLVRQAATSAPVTVAAQSGGTVVAFNGRDGDRRLAGVADGVAPNDAATVRQVAAMGDSTLASANAYTDAAVSGGYERSISATQQMIAMNNKEMRRDMSSLAAGSNALSALPQAFIPGRGMAGTAIGGSRGQTAVAMGLSKAFVGEHAPVIRAGAAVDTRRGDLSYNASVGFHF